MTRRYSGEAAAGSHRRPRVVDAASGAASRSAAHSGRSSRRPRLAPDAGTAKQPARSRARNAKVPGAVPVTDRPGSSRHRGWPDLGSKHADPRRQPAWSGRGQPWRWSALSNCSRLSSGHSNEPPRSIEPGRKPRRAKAAEPDVHSSAGEYRAQAVRTAFMTAPSPTCLRASSTPDSGKVVTRLRRSNRLVRAGSTRMYSLRWAPVNPQEPMMSSCR